jgi:hypothetical protein
MQSLTEAISLLRKVGYNEDFTIDELRRLDRRAFKKAYDVDLVYRFDVDSDPTDQSAIYAISSKDNKRRGLLVNGYGVYSDMGIDHLLDDSEHDCSPLH